MLFCALVYRLCGRFDDSPGCILYSQSLPLYAIFLQFLEQLSVFRDANQSIRVAPSTILQKAQLVVT